MNKITKIILIVALIFLAISVSFFVWGLLISGSTAHLKINGEEFVPLNKNAAISSVSNSSHPYMFYKFTDNQKTYLADFKKKNGSVALQVMLESKGFKKNNEESLYDFGFLYEEDFASATELYPELKARNSVRGNFALLKGNKIRLLFCMNKNGEFPCGFYIYAKKSCSLREVKFTSAKIGWSKYSEGEENVPLFAFGPEGGFVDSSFSTADFSSGDDVFSSANSTAELLPKIELHFAPVDNPGNSENPLVVEMKAGNENLKVIRARNLPNMVIQGSSLRRPFSTFEFFDNAHMLLSIFMSENEKEYLPKNGLVLKGLPTDLGLVPDWPVHNWRNAGYELYEWAEFPGIICFDFATSKIQDQFFTRLAYFVEKEGYKGTFVDDDFILNNHGYNAHDYGAKSLADFFSKAARNGISLNECELLLKEILIANGIIIEKSNGTFSEGKGAVVSISRTSSPELRRKFLVHECWHGIYFTNPTFRNLISGLHKKFNPQAREFLELYWANNPNLHYDRSDDFLMKNEFMAYMLQQDPEEARKYFMAWAKDSFMPRIAPMLCEYVVQTNADDFVGMSSLLNDWTFNSWGLGAGRVSLIIR